MNWLKIFMFIFLLSGSYMLYIANEENRKTNILLKFGIETDATVIENVKEPSSEGSSFRPKFEYSDKFGTIQNAMGDVATSPPAYSVGEKVRLIYNPDDVSQAKVKSNWGLHGAMTIALIIGIAQFSVAAIYFGRKIYLRYTSAGHSL